jgi:hypothetical protein
MAPVQFGDASAIDPRIDRQVVEKMPGYDDSHGARVI